MLHSLYVLNVIIKKQRKILLNKLVELDQTQYSEYKPKYLALYRNRNEITLAKPKHLIKPEQIKIIIQ